MLLCTFCDTDLIHKLLFIFLGVLGGGGLKPVHAQRGSEQYESVSIGTDDESLSSALESIHIGLDCRSYKQKVQTVDISG